MSTKQFTNKFDLLTALILLLLNLNLLIVKQNRANMKLLHIKAANYRNYRSIDIDIDQTGKYFIIKANNGSGKTNLLELIYYFTYLKSFRSTADSDLILHSQRMFAIQIKYEDNGITDTISVSYDGNKKKITCNDKKINRLSELFSRFISIIFSASDIDIITGSPITRRNFFNMFFSLIDSSYFNDIKTYAAVVKQKNFILKNKTNLSLLDIYNRQLSDIIYRITQTRLAHITEIRNRFSAQYSELGEFSETVDIRYTPSVSADRDADGIYELLCQKKPDEINAGYALSGSHRDSYNFYMNGRLFSRYASFGQCRLAALVIKLIQAQYTAEIKKTVPVLLFDDVILELDEIRKHRIVNCIKKYDQMFITFTEDIFINLFDEKDYIRIIDLNSENSSFIREQGSSV